MYLLDEVKKVEIQARKNPEWYYHQFDFTDERFRNLLDDGIKCRKLLGMKSAGNNGKYYISLLKDLYDDSLNSAFDSFMNVCTSFIISGIEPIRCSTRMQDLYHLFAWSRIPLRGSGFTDEFQAYRIITPDKFVGLQCPLYNWISETIDERWTAYFVDYLLALKDMIRIMKELNFMLPIYDYSRRNVNDVHIIDPDGYLDICDNLSDDVRKIVKKRWGW